MHVFVESACVCERNNKYSMKSLYILVILTLAVADDRLAKNVKLVVEEEYSSLTDPPAVYIWRFNSRCWNQYIITLNIVVPRLTLLIMALISISPDLQEGSAMLIILLT